MENQIHQLRGTISRDGWSKLTDGLLAALVLYLIWLVVVLSLRSIGQMIGLPGLLVFTLGLMAVAMYSLQHAVLLHHAEATRAWYGVAGGSLAWAVVEVVAIFDAPVLTNPGGIVLLLMTGMVLAVLWRHVLPVGVKFFGITLMLNWTVHVVMRVQETLSGMSPIFTLTYRLTGYAAILGVVITIGYIVFHSKRRIQRISAALLLWFLCSLALYVFRGTLY